MPFYYYLFLVIPVLIIFTMILFLVSARKNTVDLLFNEGLKQENLGHLHEAVIIYEEVLIKIGKFKFQGNFKQKVINRIKVLHTMIEYESTFRKTNSPAHLINHKS